MNAVTALPGAWVSLDHALHDRRPVWVTYHDRRRLLCPHALGWHHDQPLVLGYQTGGDTTRGTLDPDPRKRWRVLYIDQIDHIEPDPTSPWGTADNYNPANPSTAIDTIFTAINDTTPTQQ